MTFYAHYGLSLYQSLPHLSIRSLFFCAKTPTKNRWLSPSVLFFLCKSIEKQEMCHFLAPAGQPEMMHKKLHALAFAHFRGAVLTHEVLCCIWPIPSQGSIRASSISSSSAFPVSRKPRPRYRRIAGIFSGAQVITTFRESPNGFPAMYSRQSRMAAFA